MRTIRRMAQTLRHARALTRGRAQRLFAGAWLALSVLGALNARLLPGSYEPFGILTVWFPHLTYGYVMFDRMPRQFVSAAYLDPGSQTPRPLAELLAADSWGYQDARTFLTLNVHADFLPWLCKIGRLEARTVVLQTFEFDPVLRHSMSRRFACLRGELREVDREV